MTTADTFPVAAPQEKQKIPESPDFIAQIERLEGMASDGIETPNGLESMQFRSGIEVEFSLVDPANYRKFLSDRAVSDAERLERQIAERPEHEESVRKSHNESVTSFTEYQSSLILNPQKIDGEKMDTTELLDEFRQYAADFVSRLPAADGSEEEKRRLWLDQIPSFGTREIINFLLYEEFSNPTLEDVKPPVGGTVDELDAYSEKQGWLEFRFGNGALQTGYYDNEGVCEIRQAPCSPSEALRRKAVMQTRLIELADQFGVLVRTSAEGEHINLSVYAQHNNEGDFYPLIGQDEARRPRTLDITAGVVEAYADGLWLNPKNMKYPHYFQQPHGGSHLRMGPSRKGIRIVDDLIELRAGFAQADQATNWLMAGAIAGLQEGHEAITAQGYETPLETTVFRVHRQPDFDKDNDLQIQRAFENSNRTDGVFELDSGYNMIRGVEITQSLLGLDDGTQGSDILNDLVISSAQIDGDGFPYVSPEDLRNKFETFNERYKNSVEGAAGTNFEEIAAKVNARFKRIKLEPVTVITGDAKYAVEGRDKAFDRLRKSRVVKLALGDEVEAEVSWLQNASPTEEVAA